MNQEREMQNFASKDFRGTALAEPTSPSWTPVASHRGFPTHLHLSIFFLLPLPLPHRHPHTNYFCSPPLLFFFYACSFFLWEVDRIY